MIHDENQDAQRKARRRGPRALATLVSPAVGAVFAKRGFAGSDIAVHWPDIAGAGLAQQTRPLNLQWPRHGAENGVGATLVVACTPAFALDMQQMSPALVERINQRLGWRAVMRITIRQMPMPRATPRADPPRITAADLTAAGRITAEIRSDRLRDAMTRLGAASLSRARRITGD